MSKKGEVSKFFDQVLNRKRDEIVAGIPELKTSRRFFGVEINKATTFKRGDRVVLPAHEIDGVVFPEERGVVDGVCEFGTRMWVQVDEKYRTVTLGGKTYEDPNDDGYREVPLNKGQLESEFDLNKGSN